MQPSSRGLRLVFIPYVLICASTCLFAQSDLSLEEVNAGTVPYFPYTGIVLTAEAKFVQVGAVVRDRNHRAVSGLQKSDFEILDDGKKREITVFYVQPHALSATSAPADSGAAVVPAAPKAEAVRYLALFFDDLNSSLPEFRPAQVAAEQFVKESLRPEDRVAILTTGHGRVFDFSSDVSAILAAIEALRVQTRTSALGGCPQMSPFEAYLIDNRLDITALEVKVRELLDCRPGLPKMEIKPGTLSWFPKSPGLLELVGIVSGQARGLWQEARFTSQVTLDSIRYAVDFLGRMPGSRSLLLASGGFFSGGLEREQNDIVNLALRKEVTINSLDAKGLYPPPIADASRRGEANMESVKFAMSLGNRAQEARNDAMAYLAYGTGGNFYQNSNDLGRGFRELVAPEVSYLLGFSPGSADDGKRHKLTVRVTSGRGYSVQARTSYFAVPPDRQKSVPQRRIDKEVLADSRSSELPVRLTVTPGKLDDGTPGLHGIMHVNVKSLPFSQASGKSVQKINFIVALLDDHGGFVGGREGAVNLALSDERLKWLAARGMGVWFELEAPPGAYAMRFVASDDKERLLTAINEVVKIP